MMAIKALNSGKRKKNNGAQSHGTKTYKEIKKVKTGKPVLPSS